MAGKAVTLDMPRIRPPAILEKSVIEPLITRGVAGVPPCFQTKYQVMTFAATLGVRIGKETPMEKAGEGIRYEYFLNDGHDLAIDIIALEACGSESEESDEVRLSRIEAKQLKRRVERFERFAHTGLLAIEQECFGGAGARSLIEGLVVLVEKYGAGEKPKLHHKLNDLF